MLGVMVNSRALVVMWKSRHHRHLQQYRLFVSSEKAIQGHIVANVEVLSNAFCCSIAQIDVFSRNAATAITLRKKETIMPEADKTPTVSSKLRTCGPVRLASPEEIYRDDLARLAMVELLRDELFVRANVTLSGGEISTYEDSPTLQESLPLIARDAYALADAMLEARNQNRKDDKNAKEK